MNGVVRGDNMSEVKKKYKEPCPLQYPVIVKIEFEAVDEVELTAFLNHLLRFDFAGDRLKITRIYTYSQ